MLLHDAKLIAAEWVRQQGVVTPGFGGAFFHGSAIWMPDDTELAPSSDIDVMVVVDDSTPPVKLGKCVFWGVLLDVTYLSWDEIGSAEHVLGQYHLAGSLRSSSVILDPSGRLTALQRTVRQRYAKREWVIARRDHAVERVLRGLQSKPDASLPDQVNSWLFPAGVLTHVLLVAGTKNPTVRRRYVAVRKLLAAYGFLDAYEPLLALLGCATMSRNRVEHHLVAVTRAFDAAKEIVQTSFVFAADISDTGRAVAIDGSREMIARGDHREAIFWLLATYTRCQQIFDSDALRQTYDDFDQGYRELLGDLGIADAADLQRRRFDVEATVTGVVRLSNVIIASNPEIED